MVADIDIIVHNKQPKGCIMEITTSENEITAKFTTRASAQRVWASLTTKDGWEAWFSDRVESDFVVGSPLEMYFEGEGTVTATVTEREELKCFAYRWHPGESGEKLAMHPDEQTTVRFTLVEINGQVELTMTEFGFERIPADRRPKAFADNQGGWKYMIEQFEAWTESGVRQSKSKGKD